jgi:hypothetical protein
LIQHHRRFLKTLEKYFFLSEIFTGKTFLSWILLNCTGSASTCLNIMAVIAEIAGILNMINPPSLIAHLPVVS